MIVMGLDKATGKRYILDGFNMARCPPELFLAKIRDFVQRYRCKEAVIERNAFQGFVTNSADLREFMYANGCLLNPHTTGQNKHDEDLGVAAMSGLFLSCADHNAAEDTWDRKPVEKHLISLPNPRFSTFVDALIQQLTMWYPRAQKKGQLTDLVMAFWMANLAIQKVVDHARNAPRHMNNQFLPRADARKRAVVNLAEMRDAMLRETEREVSFHTGS
jgi:hypothetical protein